MKKGAKRKVAEKQEAGPANSETKPIAKRAKVASPEPEVTARRGAKRMASQKPEADPAKNETKPRGKRVKVAEPEPTSVSEPEATKEKAVKRKASRKQKAEPAKKETKPRVKRVKVAKPVPEPQFIEDQRNLEDLWKVIFPVGTEWDQFELLYQFKWDFSNLENAFEEDGKLHGKKVYLFGSSEPQLVPVNGENKIICIPVVVAVVSPFPPSDKIGIKSVQREVEEIIPMKQMKMDWVPYIPLENRAGMVDKVKSQIFILSCTQRRAALKHLKLDRAKKFEYCLPYFYQPFKEDELEQSTEVSILYPVEPKPVFCEFDWELDELEEFTDKLIEDEELSEDQKGPFQEFVKEKVREAKKANREARQARKKAVEEMSEEAKTAFENMRFYKFYPVKTADTPDISGVKSSFINRYYGKAHEIL